LQKRSFTVKIVKSSLKQKTKSKKIKEVKKKGIYSPKNVLNDLTGTEWIQETSTIWYQRGLGQKHQHAKIELEHPAPFPYSMIERLVKFFTKKDQLVLDPFCGVASTLKACALTQREGVGIELVKKWVDLSKKTISSRGFKFIKSESNQR